jgi:hypothetical protein
MSILPGLEDIHFKKGWRGSVIEIDGCKVTVICYVYDRTLKGMRKRKHAIYDLLKNQETKSR